jgi:hypothetical protein
VEFKCFLQEERGGRYVQSKEKQRGRLKGGVLKMKEISYKVMHSKEDE